MTEAQEQKDLEKVSDEIYAEIPQNLALTDEEWDTIQNSRRKTTLNNRAIANYIVSSLATGKSLRKLAGELAYRFEKPVTFLTLHKISSDSDIKPIIDRQKQSVEGCLDLVPIYSKANRILKLQEIFDECDMIADDGTRIKAKLATIKLANDIVEGTNVNITHTESKKFEFIISQLDRNNRALPERNGMNISEWLKTIPETQEVIMKAPKRQ